MKSALIPACLLALASTPSAQAQGTPVQDAGSSMLEGFEIYRSDNGATRLRIDARVSIDATVYDEGDVELDGDPQLTLSSGSEVRAARIGFKGVVEKIWSFELDMDLGGSTLDLKDAWVGAAPTDLVRYRFGQFKEPFSLQAVTSSRYNIFLERTLMDVFVPGRHIGLAADTGGQDWSLAGGVFGQEAEDNNDGNDFENADDEGYGFVVRSTFTPINREGMVIHLGASVRRGSPDAETDDSDEISDVVRYRTRSETHLNRLRFLDTGKITGVDWIDTLGVEAAASIGPVRLQGEHVSTHLSRSGDPSTDFYDADFSGYYGQVAWMITGESANYRGREGEFGRVIPERNSGAWELAYRFSGLDLDHEESGITGGTSHQRTFGVNWYANRHVRLGLNYSRVSNGENADARGDSVGHEDFSFFLFRCQLAF